MIIDIFQNERAQSYDFEWRETHRAGSLPGGVAAARGAERRDVECHAGGGRDVRVHRNRRGAHGAEQPRKAIALTAV